MSALREAIEDAPLSVLSTRQHADLIDHIEGYGATCRDCDREATPTEVDGYLDAIRNDPEPGPWTCGCTDLDDETRAAATRELVVRRSAKVTITGDRAQVVTLSGCFTVTRTRLAPDWVVRVRAGAADPERIDHGVVVDPFMRLLGLTSGRQWMPPSVFEAVCVALVGWASEDNSADAPEAGAA